jgi:hypothetical protein
MSHEHNTLNNGKCSQCAFDQKLTGIDAERPTVKDLREAVKEEAEKKNPYPHNLRD